HIGTWAFVVWTLLSILGAAVHPPSAEAAEPVSPPKSAPAPPSDAIPVAEVATRAAQVPNLLRSVTEPLAAGAELGAEMVLIRKRVPELRQQIDLEVAAASTILQAEPTLDMIQTQQQVWQHRLLQTNEWLSLLAHRASRLQAALNRLAGPQQTCLSKFEGSPSSAGTTTSSTSAIRRGAWRYTSQSWRCSRRCSARRGADDAGGARSAMTSCRPSRCSTVPTPRR